MKILVVEDDPGIVDVLEYTLQKEGHEIECVQRGSEAIDKAATVDFILLDVGLPDMDGFEVCRRVRRTLNIPILFLTSRSEEVDRVVGLELGGDDYLAKPFSTRELTARIKAIARRASQHSPQTTLTPRPLQCGVLTLDASRHLARWEEDTLELTRLEFALLARLMEEPGRVFTRDQLLDHAWPDGGCVTDRTVDAHIKSLRRKLPDPEIIETVRGVGYRLRDQRE